MNKKWNLQDIRPAEPRKKRPSQPPLVTSEQNPPTPKPVMEREHIPSIIIEDGRKRGHNRLLLSVILFVVIVGGAIALSAFTGKTELTIYPEHKELNVNAEFTAYPDKREDSLSYEIMTLEATGEAQVKASGQIQVEEQAKGLIEIRKTTPGTERLIKNTRFRTPDGLVFRTQESVVVPGAVKNEDGVYVPGTIQAEVFADEPGEKYNIAADSTFDVPGFKEADLTTLYESITATNKTAFTGGYSGPQFQIDEAELATARQKLQIDLRDGLLLRIANEKPADFVAFDGSVAISYNQLPAIEYGQDLVTIREQAVLQIPLFKSSELASFLAEQTITTYEGNPIRIEDPSVITFTYTSATTSSSVIANNTSLDFKLSGKPLFIWEYDSVKLAGDLAGLPKTAITNAVGAYPGIDAAKAHITPFWQRTFPKNPEDIVIIEELKDDEG